MLLNHNHNKFNLIVACLGFEQLIICLRFMTWIQIFFSVLGFEYSLKYGFVLLARILTRVWIQTLEITCIRRAKKSSLSMLSKVIAFLSFSDLESSFLTLLFVTIVGIDHLNDDTEKQNTVNVYQNLSKLSYFYAYNCELSHEAHHH